MRCQFGKGRKVDLTQLGAHGAPLLQRRLVGRLHLLVAVELGVADDGQARGLRDTHWCAAGVAAAVRVGSIKAAGNARYLLRVFHGQREDGNAIQRAAGREQPLVRQPATGGLEANDVVEAGGYPAGAGGVGAQGEGYETTCNHAGRAGTGATADVIRVEAVGDGAIGRAGANQSGGKLIQVGLADQNGASGAQAGDDGGVSIDLMGKRRAGGGSLPAGCVDIVLDGKRNAIQGECRQVTFCVGQLRCQCFQLTVQLLGAGKGNPGIVCVAKLSTQCRQQAIGGDVWLLVGLLPLAEGEAGGVVAHGVGYRLGYKMVLAKASRMPLYGCSIKSGCYV